MKLSLRLIVIALSVFMLGNVDSVVVAAVPPGGAVSQAAAQKIETLKADAASLIHVMTISPSNLIHNFDAYTPNMQQIIMQLRSSGATADATYFEQEWQKLGKIKIKEEQKAKQERAVVNEVLERMIRIAQDSTNYTSGDPLVDVNGFINKVHIRDLRARTSDQGNKLIDAILEITEELRDGGWPAYGKLKDVIDVKYPGLKKFWLDFVLEPLWGPQEAPKKWESQPESPEAIAHRLAREERYREANIRQEEEKRRREEEERKRVMTFGTPLEKYKLLAGRADKYQIEFSQDALNFVLGLVKEKASKKNDQRWIDDFAAILEDVKGRKKGEDHNRTKNWSVDEAMYARLLQAIQAMEKA